MSKVFKEFPTGFQRFSTVKYKFIKTSFIKTSFIKNQFHQKPVSSKTSFIKTSFIKNQLHQKPVSSKTSFFRTTFNIDRVCVKALRASARDAFTQTWLMPTFGVSPSLSTANACRGSLGCHYSGAHTARLRTSSPCRPRLSKGAHVASDQVGFHRELGFRWSENASGLGGWA